MLGSVQDTGEKEGGSWSLSSVFTMVRDANNLNCSI